MFWDQYVDYPADYSKIAKIVQFTGNGMGNHITKAELSPLGALQEINEGGAISFDNPVEGHKKTVYFTKYGLGFQITEEMLADDLHQNYRNMPQKLAKSARYKVEALFWDLFNSGFATHTSADGQYIFDTDHTTLKTGTTISNDPTAASLSETTLQAAFEYFDGLVDEAGNPIVMKPKYLVIPPALQWIAQKLHKGNYVVGSMNNDINTVNPANLMDYSWTPFKTRWLTSKTAWYILSEDHDMELIWRFPVRLMSKGTDDFLTGNALYKATMRLAAAAWAFRGSYGNSGA